MSLILEPWQFCFAVLSGRVNRQQQEVVDYLRTENQVLKETHGNKRILLSDDQRRRLAVSPKLFLSLIDPFWAARRESLRATGRCEVDVTQAGPAGRWWGN